MNAFNLPASLSVHDCEGPRPPAVANSAYETFDDPRAALDRQADRDAFVYRNCAATMRDLVDLGDISSPEFAECFAEIERIKGRNGGMPPGKQL